MRKARPVSTRYRLAVLSRTIAAIAGGYGISVMLAIALSWTLPLSREEAGTLATMLALLSLPIAIMACFYARSAWRAWIGLALAVIMLTGIALAGGWRP